MNKVRRDYWLVILMLVVITTLHYFTAHYRLQLHEFYRRLYYIPIIYGAFRFRFRGGILISIASAVLYAPHLLFYIGHLRLEILNQLMEIILFLVIGVVTGVLTERQHRQQRVVEKQLERITSLENYTHNVLQSMANGLIALDKNLQITVYNQRIADWLIWSEDMKGKSFTEAVQGQGIDETLLSEVVNSGAGRNSIDFIVSTPNGSMPMRVFVQPLKTTSNVIFGLVVIFEDLREVRKLEEEVRRAERLSAIGVMASGIAHEIRNPLGIIKTISQNIQHDGCTCNPAIGQGLEIIEEEISRANRVISELLDFARPIPYLWEQLVLDEVVQDVLQTLRTVARNSSVELTQIGTVPRPVFADRAKLKQALVNLVLNAIQVQNTGGWVKVYLSEEVQGAKICIQDAGPGVPQGIADKIFDPFFSNREGGTGLGLAVTHTIIAEHGAEISVTSLPGQGAKFNVLLPWGKEEVDAHGPYSCS